MTLSMDWFRASSSTASISLPPIPASLVVWIDVDTSNHQTMQAGSAHDTAGNDGHKHLPVCQVRQHMLWREVLSHRGDHLRWIVNGIGDPNGAQDCTTYAIRVVRLGSIIFGRTRMSIFQARCTAAYQTPTPGDIGSCIATTVGVGTQRSSALRRGGVRNMGVCALQVRSTQPSETAAATKPSEQWRNESRAASGNGRCEA